MTSCLFLSLGALFCWFQTVMKVDQAVNKMMMCQQRKSAVARMVWTQSDPVPLLGAYGSGNACTVDVRFFCCSNEGEWVSFSHAKATRQRPHFFHSKKNGVRREQALVKREERRGMTVDASLLAVLYSVFLCQANFKVRAHGIFTRFLVATHTTRLMRR